MKRGLALEGGGARGSYQAGAAKAFLEKGVEFQGIVGTSIGSINGAMIAQGDVEALWEIWSTISVEKVFRLEKKEYEELARLDFDLESVALKIKKMADIMKDGGLDMTLARQILDQYVREEDIRGQGKDFGLVTFSVTEMKPVEVFLEEIPLGELKNYLLASSALPYFKLDKIQGIKYLDGGVYNALPTDLLVKKGYEEIWEVRLNSLGRKKSLDLSQSPVVLRAVNPVEPLCGYLDFRNETANRQLRQGYYDTLRMLEGLGGEFFYLQPVREEGFFVDFLRRIPESIVEEFAESLNVEGPVSLRLLFEELIPRVAQLLGLGAGASYETIITRFLEIQGMELGMERFRIYGFREFVDLIKEKSRDYQCEEDPKNRVMEAILKNEMLSRVAREQSIRHLARLVIKEMGEVYETAN